MRIVERNVNERPWLKYMMIIDNKIGLQINRRKNVARVADDRSREANSPSM